MFKFRSGSTGLGEDRGHLKGRHYGTACEVCGQEAETREHVLFECSGYDELRVARVKQMREIVEGDELSREDQLLLVLSQPLVNGTKTLRSKDNLGALKSASLNYLLLLTDSRIELMYGTSRFVPSRIPRPFIIRPCSPSRVVATVSTAANLPTL